MARVATTLLALMLASAGSAVAQQSGAVEPSQAPEAQAAAGPATASLRFGFDAEALRTAPPAALPADAPAAETRATATSAPAPAPVDLKGTRAEGKVLTIVGGAAMILGGPVVGGTGGWLISTAGLVAFLGGLYLWFR
ncbi:MAG: hypothetical protein NW201_15490 [Gemmatimonadales bacterium]|nr:hypothetical protein [Gemmatimonadales bacterium]